MWKADENIARLNLKYEKLVDFLSASDAKKVTPKIFDVFGDFKTLLSTISSISLEEMSRDTPLRIFEWNPLSQRPALLKVPQANQVFGETFALTQQVFNCLITAIHELLHVALWEPFFCGQMPIKSLEDFRKFTLMSEAFCFFYADIILTRKIRTTYPDGEPIFSRSAVSQNTFHPLSCF